MKCKERKQNARSNLEGERKYRDKKFQSRLFVVQVYRREYEDASYHRYYPSCKNPAGDTGRCHGHIVLEWRRERDITIYGHNKKVSDRRVEK